MARDPIKIVKEYIDLRPAIQQCIKNGLIDFITLAKNIAKEEDITEKEALIAIFRFYPPKKEEKRIRAILRESKIETKSKIATLIAKNDWHVLLKVERVIERMLQVVRASTCITLVMDEAWLDEVENLLGGDVIDSEKGLAEILIKSPKGIESTPGVVSYFYDALASKGINVVETLSCYTDTVFLVKDKDLFPAYQVLNETLVGIWIK